MHQSGKIIFLNGATSAGKTTIASLLQTRIEEPFLSLSIDHLRAAGVLPLLRFNTGEFKWQEHREAFFKGFHLSLKSYAEAGNNLIVEHIIETKEWKDFLINKLDGVDMFFVAVHCPLRELQRREEHRKDRPLGGAQKDLETIHVLNTYDLELDGTLPPDQNVEHLIRSWNIRGASKFKN